MARVITFRDLLDRESRRGVPKDTRGRSMRRMAEVCGISLQHLYNLINGVTKTPTDELLSRIAKNLGVPLRTVRATVRASRSMGILA